MQGFFNRDDTLSAGNRTWPLLEVVVEPTNAEWPAAKLISWNESVGEFLAEVPPPQRACALRHREQEARHWRRQQTPEQETWLRQRVNSYRVGVDQHDRGVAPFGGRGGEVDSGG
jgi:hypothetical protein